MQIQLKRLTLTALAAALGATALFGIGSAHAYDRHKEAGAIHALLPRQGTLPAREMGHGPVVPVHQTQGGGLVSCHPFTGCTVTSAPHRDHDGYHHGDWYRWYSWNRDRHAHLVNGGAPAGSVVAPAPLPVASQGSCSCLTKHYLPTGAVVFTDVCTKESAVLPPQKVGPR
jgi:hypothetical protein